MVGEVLFAVSPRTLTVFGSTLGLVGSSNTLQTQWAYEPFGAPTLSGTQSTFPFLFGGGQYDPTGYYGDYSPRLQHSLSGGSVPYTGGSQPGVASEPRHSPPGGGVSAYQYFQDSTKVLFDVGFTNNDGRIGVQVSTNLIQDLINLFSDIFGGGGPHFSPKPYDLAASHLPECIQIGVNFALCAKQSQPKYPMGLVRVADNQSPSASPGPGHIPGFNRPFPYYKYCDPLNFAPLSPSGNTDYCCRRHDTCYQSQGLSSKDTRIF